MFFWEFLYGINVSSMKLPICVQTGIDVYRQALLIFILQICTIFVSNKFQQWLTLLLVNTSIGVKCDTNVMVSELTPLLVPNCTGK